MIQRDIIEDKLQQNSVQEVWSGMRITWYKMAGQMGKVNKNRVNNLSPVLKRFIVETRLLTPTTPG